MTNTLIEQSFYPEKPENARNKFTTDERRITPVE